MCRAGLQRSEQLEGPAGFIHDGAPVADNAMAMLWKKICCLLLPAACCCFGWPQVGLGDGWVWRHRIPPHGNRIAFFNAYISCTHPPIQHPTSNIQHPTCNIQHSTFNIQLPLMTECFWRAHRCISKFLHVIFEELFARLDECTDGCMDGWMYGWVDGWMHGRMDVWIAGCMDG